MADLKSAIELWQDDGYLLIVGSDWNEEVSSPSWQAFWNNLSLVTLDGLTQQLPTAMYNCRSKQSDMVYLSPSLYKVKVACGYLNCNDTILGANHSTFFLDVPATLLHLQAPPPHLAKG